MRMRKHPFFTMYCAALSIFACTGPLVAANISQYKIPHEIGEITSSNETSSDKVIINIQDAHCVNEAQENIIKILRELISVYNVQLVTTEGASGEIESEEFLFPDTKIRRNVSGYFLKKGKITGAEFLLINGDYKFTLRGADDKDYYTDNFNSFVHSIKSREKALELLDKTDAAFNKLGSKLLTEESQTFFSKIKEYRMEKISFVEFCSLMADYADKYGADISQFKQFQLLRKAVLLEQKINFDKISAEQAKFVDSVSKLIPESQLKELLNKNLMYKLNKISPAEYFLYLERIADSHDTEVSLADYDNLCVYISYLKIYQKINFSSLAKEVADIESIVKKAVFKNDEELKLCSMSESVIKLKRFFALQLTPREVEQIREKKEPFSATLAANYIMKSCTANSIEWDYNPADFKWIDDQIPFIENFFHVAKFRDKVLVDNTLAEMDLEGKNIAVLICGGFHTKGIEDELRKKGISFITVIPRVSKASTNDEYLQLMTGEKTPMESMLSLSNGYLAYQSLLATVALVDPDAKLIFSTSYKIDSLVQLADSVLTSDTGLQAQLAQNPALAKQSFLHALNSKLGDYLPNLKGIEIRDIAVFKTGERYYKISYNGKEMAFRITSTRETDMAIPLGERIKSDLESILSNSLKEKIGAIGNTEVALIDPSGFDAAVSYAVSHDIVGSFKLEAPEKTGFSKQAQILAGVYEAVKTNQNYISVSVLSDSIAENTITVNFLKSIDRTVTMNGKTGIIALTPKLKFVSSLYATAGNIRKINEVPGFSELSSAVDPAWNGKQIYVERDLVLQNTSGNLDISAVGRSIPAIAALADALAKPPADTDLLNYEIDRIEGTDFVKVVLKTPSVHPGKIEDFHPGIIAIREKVDEFSPVKINNIPVGKAYIAMDTQTGNVSLLASDPVTASKKEIMKVSDEFIGSFISKVVSRQSKSPEIEKVSGYLSDIKSDRAALTRFLALYPSELTLFIRELEKTARNYTENNAPHPYVIEGIMVDRGEGFEPAIDCGVAKRNPSLLLKPKYGDSTQSREVFDEIATAINNLPLKEKENLTAGSLYGELRKVLGENNVNCAAYALLASTEGKSEEVSSYLTTQRRKELDGFNPLKLTAAIIYAIDRVYRGIDHSKMVSEDGFVQSSMFSVAKAAQIMANIVSPQSAQGSPSGYDLGQNKDKILQHIANLIESGNRMILIVDTPQGIPHYIYLGADKTGKVYLKDPMAPESEQGLISFDEFIRIYSTRLTGKLILFQPWQKPDDVALLSDEQMLDAGAAMGDIASFGMATGPSASVGLVNIGAHSSHAGMKFMFDSFDVSGWGYSGDGDEEPQKNDFYRIRTALFDTFGKQNVTINRLTDQNNSEMIAIQINLPDFPRGDTGKKLFDQTTLNLLDKLFPGEPFYIDDTKPLKRMEIKVKREQKRIGKYARKRRRKNKDDDDEKDKDEDEDEEEYEIPDYTPVLVHPYDLTNFKHMPKNAYDYFGAKRLIPGTGAEVAILTAFKGDFITREMIMNILINRYGENFEYGYDAETVTRLMLYLSSTVDEYGNTSILSGEQAIMRLFRLTDTVETLNAIGSILDNTGDYTPLLRQRIENILKEIGIDPESIKNKHEDNFKKYDSSKKYPIASVEFLYSALDNPAQTLDDNFITDFFGNTKYFSISKAVKAKLELKQAVSALTVAYPSISADIEKFLMWYIEGKAPSELDTAPITYRELKLKEAVESAKRTYPESVEEIMSFAKKLSGMDKSLWANEISDFKNIVLQSESALNYLNSAATSSAISLNIITAQDTHEYISARFSPRSDNFFTGIASGKIYFGPDIDSIAPLSGTISASTGLFKNEKGKPALNSSSVQVYAVPAGDYEIIWADRSDISGKNAQETAENIHVLNAITGEDKPANAQFYNSIIAQPEDKITNSLAASELKPAIGSTVQAHTIDFLTEIKDGKYKIRDDIFTNFPADIKSAFITAVAQGPAYSLLCAAVNEARQKGLRLADTVIDASSVKESMPGSISLPNSIVLAVSPSGEDQSVIDAITGSAGAGAKVVLITSQAGSTADKTARKSGIPVITVSPSSTDRITEGFAPPAFAALRVIGLYLSFKSGLIDETKLDSELKQLTVLDKDGVNLLEKTVFDPVTDTKEYRRKLNKLIDRITAKGNPIGPDDKGETYRSFDSANIFVIASGNRSDAIPAAQGFAEKIGAGTKIPAVFASPDIFADKIPGAGAGITMPDVDSRIATISAMTGKYAPGNQLAVDPMSIGLTPKDISSIKNIVVMGAAQLSFTLDYIGDKYSRAASIPISSQFYSEGTSAISAGTIIIALNPQSDNDYRIVSEAQQKGAKVIFAGFSDIKDKTVQAGFFEFDGKDSFTASQIGCDLIIMAILQSRGEKGFAQSDTQAMVERINGCAKSLRVLADSFGQETSPNKINLERLIALVRQTGWNTISGPVVASPVSMAASKDMALKLVSATGNVFPSSPLYSANWQSVVRPGGISWFYIPAKDSVYYNDFTAKIKETAIRQSAVYPLFSAQSIVPGITVAIAVEDKENTFTAHLSNSDYCALNSNLRAGLTDSARAQIVFSMPSGSPLEQILINDIIAGSLYGSLTEDKKRPAAKTEKVAPQILIEIKFPAVYEFQPQYDDNVIRKLKEINPELFVFTIAPDGIEVGDYSDEILRMPSSDPVAMITSLEFLAINLAQQRFLFPISEINNMINLIFAKNKEISPASANNLIDRYLHGDPESVNIIKTAIAKSDYSAERNWKYINNLLEYLIYKVNINPASIPMLDSAPDLRKSVIDAAVTGAFEPSSKLPAKFSFGSDLVPFQKPVINISPGKTAVLNLLKNEIAKLIPVETLEKMTKRGSEYAGVQSQAKLIAQSDKSDEDKAIEAMNLYLTQVHPVTSRMVSIIKIYGTTAEKAELESILVSKVAAVDKAISIAGLFYDRIAEPRLIKVQNIIAEHYRGLESIDLKFRFDSYQPVQTTNTVVIDAGAISSPLLLLGEIEAELLAIMFEPVFLAVLREGFIAEGKAPEIAYERANSMLDHFTRFVTFNSEIALFDSANDNLSDSALKVISDPQNGIYRAELLNEILLDYKQQLRIIAGNPLISGTQRIEMANTARFNIVREHINGSLYSVNEKFLKESYDKVMAQINSAPQRKSGIFSLTANQDGDIVELKSGEEASDDILADISIDTDKSLPAINLINFDLISSPGKTEFLTDTDSLNVKEKIRELKSENKGPAVIYSWNRTPEDMAMRLSFFGLTVEKGLNGSTDSDVIIIGSEDLKAFAPDKFTDPDTTGVTPAQLAGNINLVLDVVKNVVFKGKFDSENEVSKTLNTAKFNIIESDPDVVKIVLDLGLKIGLSRNSASAAISFNEIEEGSKLEIGGDRINFLKTMGPDAVVDPETVIVEVSQKARPDLAQWFERASLLKKINGYLQTITETRETDSEPIEKGAWVDQLTSARDKVISAQDRSAVDQTSREILPVFVEIDSWFGKVLSVDKLDQLRSSTQVRVKDMRDEFLEVKFVLGAEMGGVAVSIPQRKMEYNIREQLRITREFDKAA